MTGTRVLFRLLIWPTVALAAACVCRRLHAEDKTTSQQNVEAIQPGDAGQEPADDSDDLDKLLDLADQDVSQLSQIKVSTPSARSLDTVVSTVSRQNSTVGRSPAAVFVITNEMIRRSGARSVPEVLRMAPAVQVARIDASKWAISIRGFGTRFANKLLVQIDGRTVYSPLFDGVFWDVQEVLLEDVERIEVIRGPGTTVWGNNAVNGVINILTKNAKDTQGTFVESGGGTVRAFSSARIGGVLTDDGYYRAYGKWFERDPGFAPGGAHDDWRMGQGGFRIDWEPEYEDSITLQGDVYDGYAGQQSLVPNAMRPPLVVGINDDAHVSGGNLLFRFRREIETDSDWAVQFYYDRAERHFLKHGSDLDTSTMDLDFQHTFSLLDRHAVIWGAGYRFNEARTTDEPFFLSFDPNTRQFDSPSLFIQDEITLLEDRWYLTLGTKLSHNEFSGFEHQPSVRILWTPNYRQSIWASVSRAVRTPSFGENDVRLVSPPIPTGLPGPVFPGIYPLILANRDLGSEVLVAYECGIREQVSDAFSWDLAIFLNEYNRLETFTPGSIALGPEGLILPTLLENGRNGQTYGLELSSTYDVTERWRLSGSYSFLHMSIEGPNSLSSPGDSPRNQLYLQSSWNLGCRCELDLIARYVDSLPAQNVPSYFQADARFAWRPNDYAEVFVAGRNLLDPEHPEFGDDYLLGVVASEVQREVYGGVSFKY